MLSQYVPSDFNGRVAAHGGFVVNSMTEIGVVVTAGLSDDDARSIAYDGAVTRDFAGEWVPPREQVQLQVPSLAMSPRLPAKNSPLGAELLASQWNMFQIHATDAWAKGSGDSRVRVAILDSGLDPDHVDQRNLIDDASSAAFISSTTGPPAWADDNLHGSFVGSIVTSNNLGIAGVAPNVTLIAVKVIDADGIGSIGDVIAGIYHATDVGAQVINMSLGLYLPKNAPGAGVLLAAMQRSLTRARNHGALVVSAAGNQATDLQHDGDFVELPCEAGVQLCVSATGNGDTFASYSNCGQSAIDIAAPGGDGVADPSRWIYGVCSSHTLDPAFAPCKDDLHYILAAGTSASAAHVSGLAAYLYSEFGPLKTSEVVSLIERNADDVGAPGPDAYFGKGRVNVAKSIGAALP